MLLPPLLLLPGCVLPSGRKRFCACLPFYEVRRGQSGKLHALQGQWGHAGDRGEGSGSLGLWAEVGGPLSRAHSPCSPPPVGGLLGPSRSSERKLRPLQPGVTWRGAVARGCLGQVLGWGQAGRWAPSCWGWPCWAPRRVGVRAGLARAEGGLVEVGAGPPSGAEVGVPCGFGGLPATPQPAFSRVWRSALSSASHLCAPQHPCPSVLGEQVGWRLMAAGPLPWVSRGPAWTEEAAGAVPSGAWGGVVSGGAWRPCSCPPGPCSPLAAITAA